MLDTLRGKLALAALGLGLSLLWGCSDKSTPAGAAGAAGAGGSGPTGTRIYLATGSQGDLIRYTITGEHSYSFTNETTGQTGSGQATASAVPETQGVYTVSTGGKTTYAIELADGIYVTSNPSGNASNRMAVGIPADMDLSVDVTPADIAGDYLYTYFSPSWTGFAFGAYRLNADFTYTWGVIPMDADPDTAAFDIANYVHGGTAQGGGTWAVHTTEKSRIVFTETETPGQAPLTGTVHPGKTMLIDEGPGKGFTIGIRYSSTAVSQASLAGTYRFIDLTSDGFTGIGYYGIPASGAALPWWELLDNGNPAESGASSDFGLYSRLSQVGHASQTVGTQEFYSTFVTLPGQVLLHFCFETDVTPYKMVSYGIGAKIN
jgi:hypothetical protein